MPAIEYVPTSLVRQRVQGAKTITLEITYRDVFGNTFATHHDFSTKTQDGGARQLARIDAPRLSGPTK
jgi:hypothetical protein